MIMYGSKVYLRAIELSDKEILKGFMNDSEIEYCLGGWSFPISDYHQEEWIMSLKPSEHTLRCMIVEKEEEITIGTVVLTNIDYKNGTAEIHIKIKKDFCGKGYGTDTVKTLTAYAFQELRLQCIYAFINAYNRASQKLFERMGFLREGVLRNRIYKKGSYHDLYVYSILSKNEDGNRE
ncbi:GNAT family N-acetyltransferase [Mobilitalea sibirica]|uniref:GNAT family N-acetyltransferase n=1 Tax=Mobilitalea sibirica TaxID=1462919 RepID=A0A8J7H4G8_9FIRM|nr:GNAT family protein [Mobilitalea sibirica]MBH1939406.1 GNAT family N-acetyltransferase [Mobilitalea sibirica]